MLIRLILSGFISVSFIALQAYSQGSCRRPTDLDPRLITIPATGEFFRTFQRINFNCPERFALNGFNAIICQPNGGWSSDTPDCVARGCNALVAAPFGSVPFANFWNIGSRGRYSCNRGYLPIGNPVPVCERSGEWSHLAPECKLYTPMPCGGRIEGQSSGEITSFNYPYQYPPNQDCTWNIIVRPGMRVEVTFDDIAIEAQSRCTSDTIEYYSGISRFTRIQRICGFITGRRFESTENIATVRFISNDRFEREGFRITWRAVGDVSIGCNAPRSPDNGMIVSSRPFYNEGEFVTYQCDPGYQLDGDERVQCVGDQTWSKEHPSCRNEGSLKYCYAVGDPHYLTFDGKRFDFQGICSYVLVRNRGFNGQPYTIEVDNEHRSGITQYSWLRKVIIRFGGETIELLKGRLVRINGEITSLPYTSRTSGLSIYLSGRFVIANFPSRMMVRFDGDSYLTVGVPFSFRDNVEGLCGDCNGDPNDDLRLDTGQITDDPIEFSNQFITETKECDSVPMRDEPCEVTDNIRNECGILVQENGCFSMCNGVVDAEPYFEACTLDGCATNEIRTSIANNIGAYAQACQDAGIQVCSTWRNDTNTQIICPMNSHYESCGLACPRTCTSRNDEVCTRPCVEGCQCDAGYLMSGQTCVRRSDCGCLTGQKYYENEVSFHRKGCSQRCECQNGRIQCVEASCQNEKRCGRDKNGRQACVPRESAICRAFGDPHYMTFDGDETFDFQGTCKYYMSRTHRLPMNDPRWFSITAQNENRRGNTRVSYLRYIEISLRSGNLVIQLGPGQTIMVNGQEVTSFDSEDVTVMSSGLAVLLTTRNGLMVSFNNGVGLRIEVPSTYRNQVNGLCGNYNNNSSDDLETSTGEIANDFTTLALSYQLEGCLDESVSPPFTCEDTEIWSTTEYCGRIIDETGPFGSCHRSVKPDTYFVNCVFDVCATEGNNEVLTEALENYARECQQRDEPICEWRNDRETRDVRCPVNSHYEGCSTPCPDSCSNPFASANCDLNGFVEACVCNVGYIRDGDDCVRRENCGCVIGEIYIRQNARLVLEEQNQECSCFGLNRFKCDCRRGYSGQQCRDINECSSNNRCDTNARCINTVGSFRCECNENYIGNGFTCLMPIGCNAPRSPDNGMIVFSQSFYNDGEFVSYQCDPGYQLDGDERVQCVGDQVWSTEHPSCQTEGTLKSCFAFGDPHYLTFDQKRFDFQGICSYVLVRNKEDIANPYIVEVDNEHRGGNTQYSWLRKVIIRFGGAVIELLKGRLVRVNDEMISLPYTSRTSGLSIYLIGRFVIAEFPSRMMVRFDGDSYLTVAVPVSFRGNVEGLCGDCNGDPNNDLLLVDTGAITDDPIEFSNQFITETKTCDSVPMRDEPCDVTDDIESECGILVQRNGCFSDCHAKVDPEPYLEACTLDGCATNEVRTSIANNIGAYAQACQDVGIQVCSTWRNDTNTQIICPMNSHYESCGLACPRTCTSRNDEVCTRPCVEGCQCDAGYLLSGQTCVRRSDCGCLAGQKYYENRVSFHRRGCSQRCECQNGRIQCVEASCQNEERCGRDENGRQACVPRGFAICRAWGDPHYMTFDGDETFDFQGTCKYYMSRTHRLPMNDPRWFSITAQNENRRGNTRVSYLRYIEISLRSGNLVIQLGPGQTIMVNGQGVTSFNSKDVTVMSSGLAVVLTTSNGLMVSFNNGVGLRIEVPSTYRNQVNGLCGNYNNKPSDDLETSTGETVNDFTTFALSYQLEGCLDESVPPPFTCEDTEIWSTTEYCGRIIDETGPFAPCHRSVEPDTYFVNCVFDVCATEGNNEVLTEALENYARDCQQRDEPICEWRNDRETRDVRCPVNSHYEGCSTPCPDSCSNPFASANCQLNGFVEACVCNVGYIRDGDDCVRSENCGCIIEENYIRQNARLVFEDRNQECACLGLSRFECECLTGYSGQDCSDLNECISRPCHANARCTNTVGSFTCECNDDYIGNGFKCQRNPIECAFPPRVRFGSLIRIGQVSNPTRSNDVTFQVGTNAIYRCNEGFELIGSRRLACTQLRTWTPSSPACRDVNECLQSGVCHANANCLNMQGSFLCRCRTGFTGNGFTCTPVLVCRLPPSRPFATITNIDGNTNISVENGLLFPAGSEAFYECNSGYVNTGRPKYICSHSGVWAAGTPPTCTRLSCDQLPQPSNGIYMVLGSPPYSVSSSLRYACNDGFRLVGVNNLRCNVVSENAVWSNSPPFCDDVDECLEKTHDCHSAAICTNTRGSFRCKCLAGFTGNGKNCRSVHNCVDQCHANAQCELRNGVYSCRCNDGYRGDGTSCTRSTCEILSAPTNGFIQFGSKASYFTNDVLFFRCNPGYNVVGSQLIICFENGLWSADPPTCSNADECQTASTCDSNAICRNVPGGHTCTCREGYRGDGRSCTEIFCTPPVANVQSSYKPIEPKYFDGDEVTFECNLGFVLDRKNSRLTCLPAGVWSETEPFCTDVNECNDGTARCHANARCINSRGSFVCRCRSGYRGNGRECEGIPCPNRPDPKYGFSTPVQEVWSANDVITYECDPGFIRVGHRRARCQTNQMWSAPVPECRDINECASNPCVANEECVNNIGGHDCRCIQNYQRISGICQPISIERDEDDCTVNRNLCHEFARCQNNECICIEGYIGDGINCEVPVCLRLSPPSFGSILSSDETLRVNTVLTFFCNSGFVLVGDRTSRCTSDQIWTEVVPSCRDINECNRPNICSNDASCENTPGSYTCICQNGLAQKNGVCESMTCNEPVLPGNILFSPRRQVHNLGDDITYRCPNSYFIQGVATVTCGANGVWSSPIPSCKRQTNQVQFCTVSGDPHYDTFDHDHFDFQGKCVYDLVKTTEQGEANGLTKLTIETENEVRDGLDHVTWLRKAFIRFDDFVVELRKGPLVLVNNLKTNLPFNDGPLQISASGLFVIVTTDFGLNIRYDGDHYLTIGLPTRFQSFVEGLCGNYNSNPEDDKTLRNSTQIATNVNDFGNSFQISPQEECAFATGSGTVCLNPALIPTYENRCNIIRQAGGCFSNCHSTFEPTADFDNCVFDLCALTNELEALASNVGGYANKCQRQGISVCDWRSEINAPANCPKNSQYTQCGTACPNTCASPFASNNCDEQCVEGCVCDDGFILSADECVPRDQCGCNSEGRYHKSGDSFYLLGCTQLCTCRNGVVTCEDQPCGYGEKCISDNDGVLFCDAPTLPCNEQPLQNLMILPSDCNNQDGSFRLFDVGSCPSSFCSDDGSCCGPTSRTDEEVTCSGGNTYTLARILQCGCMRCAESNIFVSGRVYTSHDYEDIVPNCLIIQDSNVVARTDEFGDFNISVESTTSRLVLTFVDPSQQLITVTKVFPFKRFGGSIFYRIRLPPRVPQTSFNPNRRAEFYVGDKEQLFIHIEPTSYFQQNTRPYSIGSVFRRVTFLDTREALAYLDASGDFTTENGATVRSYGMFEMDFRSDEMVLLDVRNIRAELSTAEVLSFEDRQAMRLWSLDTDTGLWVDEGDASVSSGRKGGFVVSANIPFVGQRRLFNFDVATKKSCFAKVRAFESSTFEEWNQISNVRVQMVATDGLGWRIADSSLTYPGLGACIRTFCDGEIFNATFTAQLSEDKSSSLIPANSEMSSLSKQGQDYLEYRTTGSSINIVLPATISVSNKAGPFFEDKYTCLKSPIEENHFSFYSSQPLFEFNSVYFDVNNIFFSWQPHPLSWYPVVGQNFRACYARVNYNTRSRNVIQSRSNKPGVGLYGIREIRTVESGRIQIGCIEYRCSYEATDRTNVDIISPSRCRLSSVNARFESYLRSLGSYRRNPVRSTFTFTAPEVNLGPTYGLYTASAYDPQEAKQIARSQCISAQMSSDDEAATFNC